MPLIEEDAETDNSINSDPGIPESLFPSNNELLSIVTPTDSGFSGILVSKEVTDKIGRFFL